MEKPWKRQHLEFILGNRNNILEEESKLFLNSLSWKKNNNKGVSPNRNVNTMHKD